MKNVSNKFEPRPKHLLLELAAHLFNKKIKGKKRDLLF